VNAMRCALDDEQFAIGKEVRESESSGLRHCRIVLSSHHQCGSGDPGQLILNVVTEHLPGGAKGSTTARSAKIEDPVHPESDGLVEGVLQQSQSLGDKRIGLWIERWPNQSQRGDSVRRFDCEVSSDLAAE